MGFSEVLQTGVGFLGSAFSGGLLGVVGGLASGILNFFKDREANKFALEKMSADREMVRLEAESAVKVAQAQAQIAQDQADGQAFVASQTAAGESLLSPTLAKRVSGWAANILACIEGMLKLIRPALTVAVLWQFNVVLTHVQDHLKKVDIGPEYWQKIYMMLVDASIFLTLTVVGWWFASREIQRWAAKRLA